MRESHHFRAAVCFVYWEERTGFIPPSPCHPARWCRWLSRGQCDLHSPGPDGLLRQQMLPTRPHFLPGFQGHINTRKMRLSKKPPKNTAASVCWVYRFIRVWGHCLGCSPPRAPAGNVHTLRYVLPFMTKWCPLPEDRVTDALLGASLGVADGHLLSHWA